MNRRALLSEPHVNSTFVLDGEACRLGASSAARRRLQQQAQQQAEARAREQAEADRRAQMKQLADLAQALAGAADELARKREELIDHLKEQSVRLALAVAARLLVRETEANEQFALAAVREALEGTINSDIIRIRLNPQDRILLSEAIKEELGTPNVEIVPDAAIRRGGCKVDTHFGTIDATLDTRWARMVQTLCEQLPPQGPDGDADPAAVSTDPVDEVLL